MSKQKLAVRTCGKCGENGYSIRTRQQMRAVSAARKFTSPKRARNHGVPLDGHFALVHLERVAPPAQAPCFPEAPYLSSVPAWLPRTSHPDLMHSPRRRLHYRQDRAVGVAVSCNFFAVEGLDRPVLGRRQRRRARQQQSGRAIEQRLDAVDPDRVIRGRFHADRQPSARPATCPRLGPAPPACRRK